LQVEQRRELQQEPPRRQQLVPRRDKWVWRLLLQVQRKL
jgi:hypothetical protein